MRTSFLAMMLFGLCCTYVFSQEAEKDKTRDEQPTKRTDIEIIRDIIEAQRKRLGNASISVDVNGKLTSGWISGVNNMTEGQLPFFEDKELHLELDLAGKQEKDFEQAIKGWRKRYKANYESLSKSKEQTERTKLWKKFETINSEAVADIDDMLLQHQRERVSQIQIRFLFRSYGLFMLSLSKELQELFELSKEEIRSISAQAYENRKEMSKDANAVRQKAIDAFLKPLDEKQKALVFKKWSYLNSPTNDGFDRLRFHFGITEDFEMLKKVNSTFVKIDAFPMFVMAPSGAFAPLDLERKFDPEDENWIFARNFFRMLKDDSFVQAMEFSETQLNSINMLSAEFRKINDEATTISINWKGGTEEKLEAMKRQVDSMRQKSGQVALAGIKANLVETQWKAIQEMGERNLERMYGPVYGLLQGRLGEQLKLSDAKKKQLKNTLEKAQTVLTRESIRIEEKWWKLFLEKCDAKTKKRFADLFGPKLNKSPANLGKYLE